MRGSLEDVIAYMEAREQDWLEDLETLLRFSSIAVDPSRRETMEETVQWLEYRLREAGFHKVECFATDGMPVLLAHMHAAESEAPTVLVYGHYDVQSPEPLEEWTVPPFQPTRKGDYLYARGSADMKGQLMVILAALEAWHATGGCPVHIKFLLEGEEELGSPGLGAVVVEHREELRADFALNLDAGMIAPDTPTITTALRGAMLFDVMIQGSDRDLHSGIFGGLVANPIHMLCQLLSGLQDRMGNLTLPGVYDRVLDQERVERVDGDLSEEVLSSQVGAAALEGEKGFSPFERTTIRPSLDVLQIHGGAQRTAIPSRAGASISMRTVPDQDPEEIHQLMLDYFEASLPNGVRWDLHWKVGVPPVSVDIQSSGIQAMANAMKQAWGCEPAFLPGGGTIPVVPMLQEILGIQSVLTGFSLPDDGMHGPDERVHLPTLRKGTRTLIHFFLELASQEAS